MKEQTILSQNLKTLRKVWKFTQQQTANLLGIKRSTYAYYEHGVNPGNEMIGKISELFKINPYHLVYVPLDENGNPLSDHKLHDDTNIFETPIPEIASKVTFPTLKTDEKLLIGQLRMVTPAQKEKIMREVSELIEKIEQ